MKKKQYRLESIVAFIILLTLNLEARGTNPVWTGEAESAVPSGTVEITEGCANASGGEFVKMLNAGGNAILFEGIMIEKEGSYELGIDYFQAADSKLELIVNDISLGEILFPAAQWCYQAPAMEYSTTIDVVKGANKVELRVVDGITGPFVDRLNLFDPDNAHVPGTYYVSSSQGDDANDGLTKESPFKTLERISGTNLGPGDSILFKTGDSFVGQLVVNGSGSRDSVIVISAYGDGDKPILDGSNVEGGDHLATILINNQGFITVEKLEITNERKVSRNGVSDNLAYGIYVHNSGNEIMSDLTFKHLTIRDIYAISLEGVEFNSIKVAAIGFKSEKNMVAGKEKHIRDVIVDSIYVEHTTRYGIHTAHGGGDEGIGNDSLNRNMNLVFRNSHFYQTGGSCITPGRSYNCLVENNIFEYPGSDYDPRMANRGSGAWFWSCQNVIAQYNKIYHVRGHGDSYGMHIDFGNTNVILQYNYSEDSEGGFVEILGNNINSVYRFNISVNDGFRDNKGNTLWVSDFAGTNNRIRSQDNYIYNNSIYVDKSITPDISITSFDTYVFNNIFYTAGAATIGQQVTVDIAQGSNFVMSNNLFYGNVSSTFRNYDANPVYGDPQFTDPGSQDIDGYRISESSPALTAGITFPEPAFPNAGKGIFKDLTTYPEFDLYGNPVNVRFDIPSIGAYNGDEVTSGIGFSGIPQQNRMLVHPNPVKDHLHITLTSESAEELRFVICDFQGRIYQSIPSEVMNGENKLKFQVDPALRNGMYVISKAKPGFTESQIFVLVR